MRGRGHMGPVGESVRCGSARSYWRRRAHDLGGFLAAGSFPTGGRRENACMLCVLCQALGRHLVVAMPKRGC